MKTERIAPQGQHVVMDRATGEVRERRYRLRVVSGPQAGQSLELTGVTLIGSAPELPLVLTDSTISRHHIELEPRSEGLRLRDLDSTNGSFVGGARLREAMIERTTQITVGRTELELIVDEDELLSAPAQPSFGTLIGESPVMRSLYGRLEQVAPTDATVLLLGETGTGKEKIAEALHQRSQRAARSFVVVDCRAGAQAVERELFDAGAFQNASGGTLYLDEVAELPAEVQPQLVRVLETGLLRRSSDARPRKVDLRVVASTHRDLQGAVKAGKFREDLYYRLAVVVLQVPALRERPDDIERLVQHFANRLGRGDALLPAVLVQRFVEYGWPGNVRELKNVVDRALLAGDQDPLATASGPPRAEPDEAVAALPFKEAKDRLVDDFTRLYLKRLLDQHDGNVTEVARVSGIARPYVHALMVRHGLKR